MNVLIKGVWYTEKHAKQLGLIKKPVKKVEKPKEERSEHKKKFDKKD